MQRADAGRRAGRRVSHMRRARGGRVPGVPVPKFQGARPDDAPSALVNPRVAHRTASTADFRRSLYPFFPPPFCPVPFAALCAPPGAQPRSEATMGIDHSSQVLYNHAIARAFQLGGTCMLNVFKAAEFASP